MNRPRRIIHDLASMPTASVRRELEQVRAERHGLQGRLAELRAQDTRLEIEEQLLAQMLRLRQWEEDGVPGAADTVEAIRAAAPARKRENLSANVLSVVRQAERPLLPADVRQRLADKGIQMDASAVRVALRRWVERGELTKRGRAYEARSLSGVPSSAAAGMSFEK